MMKKDILKKLKKTLKNDVDYTFINLDLREYSHENGVFLAYKMSVDE